MERSNDLTERNSSFFGNQQAHLREWGWACLLLAVGLASHAWREATWRARIGELPSMSHADLLCWLEETQVVVDDSHRKTWSPQSSDRQTKSRGKQRRTGAPKEHPKVVQAPIDINEATVDDWDALPGFGPVLSRRTVKFREALRGFASVDQLHMVYGLDSATVLGVRGRLHADAKDIRPMCMDSLSFRFLVKHPLFDATATRNVLRAWGRGAVSMDVFWARLNASVEEREKWAPYLHICEPPTHVHK